jgi:hypothetical protein
MHQKTKVQLSTLEQELMQNAGWILTKNAVMEKMKVVLQECLEAQQELFHEKKIDLPPEIYNISPKISRGENYRGLPWLMLDHPRYFDKENVFAIRTFFWWGRHFSITLHLSGRYKGLFAQKINTSYPSLSQDHFYCCINANEWEHHFGEDNYKLIGQCNEEEFHHIIDEKRFIKLSTKIDLTEWERLPLRSFAINNFFLEVLS